MVLDTSAIRTGLQFQLRYGTPPFSLGQQARRELRIFMERETLDELVRKIKGKFAKDLGAEPIELIEILNRDWLPHIRIVELPPDLRKLDSRALDVRALDADDYSAASLAALLSPCVLMTRDITDFAPLGMEGLQQGVEAVKSVVALRQAESRVTATAVVPAAPVVLTYAAIKALADRYGPIIWLIAGIGGVVGAAAYRGQPEERRQVIRARAGEVASSFLEMAAEAYAAADAAERAVADKIVRGPVDRSAESAVLRALALADGSLSAQQIIDSLAYGEPCPSVRRLRAWLHENKPLLVEEVRRGGFLLGRRLKINIAVALDS
jgi:hypothetical protein